MSNCREDYRGPKAKITFNQVKKRRKGKIILVGIGCLCIALVSGMVTAVLMLHHVNNVSYYLSEDTENETSGESLKIHGAVKTVSKSIVSIISINNIGGKIKESNVSVGIVIEDGQYVVTSYDSIDNANDIKIKSFDDVIHTASIIGFDSIYDIAMLKLDGEPLTPIKLVEDSTQVRDGDTVISIGNPMGNPFNQGVEVGIVTNTNENIIFRNNDTRLAETLKLIKTDILPRFINTGAALCNLDGELIGVNNTTMQYHKDFRKSSFYISVDDLEPITAGILDKQNFLINYLGIYGEKAVSQKEGGIDGVYAKDVTKNGIGYDAGIRPTDIITKLNGVAVNSVEDINTILDGADNGEKIEITVFKDGKYVTYIVNIVKDKNKGSIN